MAVLIRRNDGRFEIRESVSTLKGPRSRTLAIFSVLTGDLLDTAERRATRPFDRRSILRSAGTLEAPWSGPGGLNESRNVLARLASGDLPPTFVAALKLATAPSDAELPDTIPPMLDWIGVDDEHRGRALAELMRLGDRIMRSRGVERTGDLTYPPLRDLG